MPAFVTNTLNTLLHYALSYGGKIVIATLVVVVGFWLVKVLLEKLKKGKLSKKLEDTVESFVFNFINIALKVIIIITAISILGVPMASVITVLATAGAAVGLALQGSLSNLAGGIMLVVFKPFRVGDFIESQGVSGSVEEITIMYTVLNTPDNKSVSLPNGALMNSTITNYSKKDLRRVDLTFCVAYDSDIDRVREVLDSIAKAHPLVLDDPATAIVFTKQGDSALEFTVRAWAKNSDYWTVYFDINEAVKKAFDKTGIEIPYPQMDVHIKNDK